MIEDGKVVSGSLDHVEDDLTFSANGQHLAFAVQGNGDTLVVEDGKGVFGFNSLSVIDGLVFSANSQHLAFAGSTVPGEHEVIEDGKVVASGLGFAGPLTFSPDGKHLAFLGGGATT